MSNVWCNWDFAQHTVTDSQYFSEQSVTLIDAIGPDLSPAALDDAIIGGAYKCFEATTVCDVVFKVKEDKDIARGATHINETGFKQYLENASSV